MKKILLTFVAASLCCAFIPPSGYCDSLVFFKEGTSTTITSYNDDGKVTGSTKTNYSKVVKSGNSTQVTAKQESFDKKGKSSATSEYTVSCNEAGLFFDMKMMAADNPSANNADFEMSMEGADKEFPANLTVGSTLKDARIKMTFKSKSSGMPMPMMNMEMKMTNRKVEAKENVTTPAGTYECFKITEDVESKTMFTVKMKTATWFSQEAGTVKTETYKENGKLMGKSELTELKKP